MLSMHQHTVDEWRIVVLKALAESAAVEAAIEWG